VPRCTPYDPFGLLVATRHAGDFAAAGAELRHAGLGAPDRPLEQLVAAGAVGDVVAPAGPPLPDRLVPGGTFILDTPDHVPAVWGTGEHVLWAEGETLIVAGPTGVGKTTLIGQVLFARLARPARRIHRQPRPVPRLRPPVADPPRLPAPRHPRGSHRS
jgi:hypothetical protein